MVLVQIPHIIRSYRLSLRDRPLALCIIFEILQVGLKRIDAAIDALVPLGFSREVVCKTIKNLLKVMFYTLLGYLYCSVWHMISGSWIQVYGEDGWVFIEEACYKTVIEAILEEQVEETRKVISC